MNMLKSFDEKERINEWGRTNVEQLHLLVSEDLHGKMESVSSLLCKEVNNINSSSKDIMID